MARLDGTTAVVTGASSGIGEGTSRLFVAEGASVVLVDVDDERGNVIADQLGERALYVHADVTDDDQVKVALASAVEHFGRLDCVFNNAGALGEIGSIEDCTLEGFDRTIAVLLRGVFIGIRAAASIMKPQGSGSIINTASVAGLQSGFGDHAYSAGKAAVIQLTRTTANELGEAGVRVNAICPGGIATSIVGRAFGLDGDAAQRSAEIMQAAQAEDQPIRRAGQPVDIAEAALWLASDRSEFVNGHTLVVDGGQTTGRAHTETRKRFEEYGVALRSVDG